MSCDLNFTTVLWTLLIVIPPAIAAGYIALAILGATYFGCKKFLMGTIYNEGQEQKNDKNG